MLGRGVYRVLGGLAGKTTGRGLGLMGRESRGTAHTFTTTAGRATRNINNSNSLVSITSNLIKQQTDRLRQIGERLVGGARRGLGGGCGGVWRGLGLVGGPFVVVHPHSFESIEFGRGVVFAEDEKGGSESDGELAASFSRKMLCAPTSFLGWLWSSFQILLRGAELFFRFLPLGLLFPFTYLSRGIEANWQWLFCKTLCACGPCFVKLGQWMAMRPDIFSRELCNLLQTLHMDAPQHPPSATKRIVKKSFGVADLQEMFLEFEEEPVASGAIAQVHRGKVMIRPSSFVSSSCGGEWVESEEKGKEAGVMKRWVRKGGKEGDEVILLDVAVKVAHPYVFRDVQRDLSLLMFFSQIVDFTGLFPFVSFKKSMSAFSERMLRQVNLAVEGENFYKFRENFREEKGNFRGAVQFPLPIYPLSCSSLMMTYEEAIPIREFLKGGSLGSDRFKKKTASLGIQLFLKMLLADNLLHCDLHPGNLFVRSNCCQCKRPSSPSPSFFSPSCSYGDKCDPQLVVFDCGLVLSLHKREVRNLGDLFERFVKKDFEGGAKLLIERNPQNDSIPGHQKERFKSECSLLFSEALSKPVSEIPLGEVLLDLMKMCRMYNIRLENNFATLIVGLLVVEGLGRELTGEFNFLEESVCAVRNIKGMPNYFKSKTGE